MGGGGGGIQPSQAAPVYMHMEEKWGEPWPSAECDKATVNLSLFVCMAGLSPHSPMFPDLRVPSAQEPLKTPFISKSKTRCQDMRDEFSK